jgi:hypothetical protein
VVYAKPAGCRLRLGMCDKCEGPAYYRWDYPDCANNVPIDARRTKNPVFVAFAERFLAKRRGDPSTKRGKVAGGEAEATPKLAISEFVQ